MVRAIAIGGRRACVAGWILAVSLLLQTSAWAQTPEWIVRYNGPVGNNQDYCRDIAVDSAGNVHVTGTSYNDTTVDDYATVKYTSAGVFQWAARYHGPGNDTDQAWAVAVDAASNIYVTGNSYGGAPGYDMATVRYNPNGGQAWVARYNGPSNSEDVGRDVEVGADGTINVTGYSYGPGTDQDYATIKYSAAGAPLWTSRYNNVNSTEQPWAIAVDSAGNVYVTGQSYNGSNYDYATVKYAAAGGGQMWVDRYNGPGNLVDVARSIVVDGAGNAYVTGYSNDSATQNDYVTIKYNTNGIRQWTDRYNGNGGGPDEAYQVAVDAAGNMYVTGSSAGSGARDYATIKYDANGNRLWVSSYDGPANHNDYALDLGLDQVGNVFVTGYSYGGDLRSNDYATVKYDSDGNTQWVARYDVPGTGGGGDVGTALAVDANGTAYVTGYSYSASNGTAYDYATIKYFECTSILPDCNGNGIADNCDISGGASEDCNTNEIPDECDITASTSGDCDDDGVPDECQGAAGIVQWTGANNGSWNVDENWNTNEIPSGGAFALLYNDTGGDNRCRLTTPGTTGVCSLTVSALGPGRQILEIANGSTLRSAGGVDLGPGGDIFLTGGELAGGSVANTSDSLGGYGTVSADVDNQGDAFVEQGRLLLFNGVNFDNRSDGQITCRGGSIMLLESPSLSQVGDIEVQALAGLFCLQPLVNDSGGVIRLLDGVIGADGITNEVGASIFGFGAVNSELTNNGDFVSIADTSILGDLDNDGVITIQSGTFTITGGLTGSGTIIGAFGSRDGPDGGLAVHGDYHLDSAASLSITGGSVKLAGDCDVAIDDSARFDLTTSALQMTGLPTNGIQTLEVMAENVGCGATLPDASLYSLKTLRIGPTMVMVRLVDNHDNSTGGGAEAVYADELIMHPGTILDLAGLSLYFRTVSPANAGSPGSGVQVVDTVGGGTFCQMAGPIRGDFIGDNGVDAEDVPFFIQVLLGVNTNPVHLTTADMNADGRSDGADVSPFVTAMVAP